MSEQKYIYHPEADYQEKGEFIRECKDCGYVHHVFTQQDSNPEYHTDVGVLCVCGSVVWFSLPVN